MCNTKLNKYYKYQSQFKRPVPLMYRFFVKFRLLLSRVVTVRYHELFDMIQKPAQKYCTNISNVSKSFHFVCRFWGWRKHTQAISHSQGAPWRSWLGLSYHPFCTYLMPYTLIRKLSIFSIIGYTFPWKRPAYVPFRSFAPKRMGAKLLNTNSMGGHFPWPGVHLPEHYVCRTILPCSVGATWRT